jgi:putative membrane-bound dehydrogenase-like protein
MPRFGFLCLFTLTSWIAGQGTEKPTPGTHQVQLNGHTFTLPAGFEIELVAGPPLVDRPIVADFDEKGHLYVADSSGSNDKVEVQLKNKPHRIVRLEDTDGDGRFDRRTVFADKMMFPEGAMWYAGSLYVAAPPSIWKLTDTKGTGVADQRIEWFQGKTLTGCANDLHGPYLGPDGWIYWCKGAFARQTYPSPQPLSPTGRGANGSSQPLSPEGRGGKVFSTRAAHIFRARPDRSGIEPVMTGGMDNPVEVVFTPGGERIFTTTFLQTPGGGKRDGLIHAIYGGIYGKDHDPIYEHKWTAPSLMPVMTHFGAAAPAGLCRYESELFGKEYRDNLFACQFNMHKVSRHVLTPEGATFKSRDEDFLVSSNLDFHPTDVLEDADGSLLVLDTGGWYKLCCPSSQLHKPDLLGAIYRIRKTGAARVADPRGLKEPLTKMSAEELVNYLDDPRPAVRRRVIQILADRNAESVPALVAAIRVARSAERRRNAVWALTRIKDPSFHVEVLDALYDEDETVRQAAIHAASVRRAPLAAHFLRRLLLAYVKHGDRPDSDAKPAAVWQQVAQSPHNARAIAEALGRLGDASAVPILLECAGLDNDRVLEHSITYALIEIGDRDATARGLDSSNPRIRRAALVALDQMENGKLEATRVAAELTSPDAALKATAWWIASRHPEWGTALAGILQKRLSQQNLAPAERDELAGQLGKFARTKPVQEFLAERVRDTKSPVEVRRVALRAMALSGLKEPPQSWLTGVMRLLDDSPELLSDTVTTVRALRIPEGSIRETTAALIKVANRDSVAPTVRLTALAAVPGGPSTVEPALFSFLRSRLDPDQPVGERSLTAEVLSRSKLSAGQLVALAESLDKVGPLELGRVIEAFGQSADEQVGLQLIAHLKSSSALAALRADALKQSLSKFPSAVQERAGEIFAALAVDEAKQKQRLEQLLTTLKGGDIRRGQAVFNSTKASCSACHAIGYLGGNVGPDLTHIGKIRTERDLLESIVFPSASFVRSYEPVVVATKDGKFINGLIRSESAEDILLATGVNQEARVARTDIETILPSKVSVMPSGLDQQLSPSELADLVAFLKACQ